MNNRYISQFSALLFLAVWHGLHTGYYMCFFLEFIVMNLEKDVRRRLVLWAMSGKLFSFSDMILCPPSASQLTLFLLFFILADCLITRKVFP